MLLRPMRSILSQRLRKTCRFSGQDTSRKTWNILACNGIFTYKNAFITVLVVMVVAIQVQLAAHIGDRPPLADGVMYSDLSKISIFHKKFWLNPRAPFYPILLQILNNKIYIFQKLLYALSGITLIYKIFRNSSNIFGATAVILIFFIVSCEHYAMWGNFVMTESYTFSGCLLLIFFGVMLPRHAWASWSGIFVVLSTLILTRDVMLYFGVSFLILLSIGKVWGRLSSLGKGKRPRSQAASGIDGWRRGVVALSLGILVAVW